MIWPQIEGPASDREVFLSGQGLSRHNLVFHKVTINLLFLVSQKNLTEINPVSGSKHQICLAFHLI